MLTFSRAHNYFFFFGGRKEVLTLGILCYVLFLLLPVTCTLISKSILRLFKSIPEHFSLQLVTVSQRVLQMTGHVCRKLHPQSSLGSASVRTTFLDGSVISVFQVTGDTEEIHLENAEVSYPF